MAEPRKAASKAPARQAATRTPPRAAPTPAPEPVWEPAEPPAPPAPEAGWGPPQPGPGPAQPMDDRSYAMLLHLSALGGLVIGMFFLGPLILWLVRKDRSPFVDAEGRGAVNFHLSMLLYAVAAGVLAMVITIATLGLGLLLLMPLLFVGVFAWIVLSVVFPIVAAVKANQGLPSRYPLSIRFIRPPGPYAAAAPQ